MNLIEIFRALVAADFQPSTPLELHWYSGEEDGLLGSQAIARDYKSRGVAVKAFLELDMTAYFAPGSREVIALEADYIDNGVNTFVKQLVENYSNLDWAMDIPVRVFVLLCAVAGADGAMGGQCGYACSDHASWYQIGRAHV